MRHYQAGEFGGCGGGGGGVEPATKGNFVGGLEGDVFARHFDWAAISANGVGLQVVVEGKEMATITQCGLFGDGVGFRRAVRQESWECAFYVAGKDSEYELNTLVTLACAKTTPKLLEVVLLMRVAEEVSMAILRGKRGEERRGDREVGLVQYL
jgi:hypothetical protein